MQFVGEALVLVGATLTLLAGIGVVRFHDVFARMHSLAKATTAGVLFALVGAACTMSNANDATSMVFAAVLQIVTNPVSSMMLTRATYVAEGVPFAIDAIDELAQDNEAAG